jgi:hypothetical protein
MFLRSFTDLRAIDDRKLQKIQPGDFSGLLREMTFETLAHLGPAAFSEISGEVVSCVLFVLANTRPSAHQRIVAYRLIGPKKPEEKDRLMREAAANRAHAVISVARQESFLKLPFSPLPYWLTPRILGLFELYEPTAKLGFMGWGVSSSNNRRFLRFSWEALRSERWRLHAKGGTYGRWAGLVNYLLDWYADGTKLKEFIVERYPYLGRNYEIKIRPYTFGRIGWTYSSMSRGCLGVRLLDAAHTTNAKSPALFLEAPRLDVGAILNSRLASYILRAMAPTLNIDEGYVGSIPMAAGKTRELKDLSFLVSSCLTLKRALLTRNLLERSFDPNVLPLSPSISERFREDMEFCTSIGAVLHTLEGVSERKVFASYAINGEDLQRVFDETGQPPAWFPLVSGYDAPPESAGEVGITLESLAASDRRTLMDPEINQLKQRLRTLYEIGRGRDVEAEAVEATDSDEGGKGEVEDEGDTPIGALIPLPAETFVEEVSTKLQIHPISVYRLLKEGREKEGWRCLPEERRFVQDVFSIFVLRLLGHRWPSQIEAGQEVPKWADKTGIIPITEAGGQPTLLERIRDRIASEFGSGRVAAVEREFAEVIGKSLSDWLVQDFFEYHVSQFRKRPVAWQIQSKSLGGDRRSRRSTHQSTRAFSCLVYYHGLDSDLLPKLLTHYVGPLRSRFQTELDSLEQVRRRTDDQEERRFELENKLQELRLFEELLGHVTANGFACATVETIATKELDVWCSRDGRSPVPPSHQAFLSQESRYDPDLNDGVRVNIAPIQKAGLLAGDVLAPKDVDKAIADRAVWRADERRWCREGKLASPGWWPVKERPETSEEMVGLVG